MKFGYFDDDAREYVITTPDTPLPWINYLGTEGFFSLISNTCGGYSFYKDAKLLRITRYRYNTLPVDSNGKYYYINDDSVTSGHYSAGKLTELKAWRRICEVFADEPFVYRSARAGYALRCREIVVKYCKDDAFMEQACAEAEREFKRNAGPLLAGWLRAGQYRYFIKTLYSYLLWNSWLKKKQARKTYEVEI